MIQAPNYANPYLQPQLMPMQAPNYNAVKIDVHNPSVSAPGVGQVAMNVPQYSQPTAPIYDYPKGQLYDYQQAQVQPYYVPMQPVVCPPCPACEPKANIDPAGPVVAPEAPVAAEAAQPAVIQQQNINVPQPVVTQPVEAKAPEAAPQVEVVPPAPMTPQVDLNSFIAKLTSPDYEVQAAAMEEIANMVKDEPQKATELLDEKVVNSLNSIINADSSKLAGPTAEQVAAREKLLKGEKLSDEDNKLATTITPMEQAERNKSYAIYTSAIMQKLFGEEVTKLTGSTVPLTELPGAVAVVEQLKNNENPMVRTSAVEALSYIQQPAYKEDLKTIFTIAQNDQDKNVQEAAKAALDKLEQIKA